MNKVKLPLFLFVILFILTSCEKPLYHDFIGRKLDYKVTVPYSWKEIDELNEHADLCLGDSKNSQYMIIICDYREDFKLGFSVLDYYELSMDSLIASHEDAELIKSNNKSYEYIVSAVSEGVKVTFYVCIKEGLNNYYQLVCWTTERQFDETKEIFASIADAFINLN